MIDEQSAPQPPPRATLKLKGGPSPARQVAPPAVPPAPAPKRAPNAKATWSDPYISQMQAEMDELARR